MKLVFFDDFRLGVMKGNNVVDITGFVRDLPHSTPQLLLNGVIQNFPGLRLRLNTMVSESQGIPASEVKFRSPVPKPNTIVAMAVNYMEA